MTALLCEALSDLGLNTTCYASWVEPDYVSQGRRWKIVRPAIGRGSRWGLPHRVLAWQAARAVLREHPKIAICVGLTSLCGMVLNSKIASKIYVWELTNAEPGNKFVSDHAVTRLNKCRGLLSPAAAIDEAIRRTYGYTRPIHRLPFWVETSDLKYLKPPKTYSCDFLFLSRREIDKGLEDLLDAIEILGRKRRDFVVLIAGQGETDPWTKKVSRLGVQDIVSFTSLPNRNQAMSTLMNARYLVLPSWHEGYPISILEATQRSVPVVCTPVGAIREMLGESRGVLYHEPQNANSLADVMSMALDKPPAEYDKMRVASRHRFEATLGQKTTEESLLKLIKEASEAS